ncbi:MAG: TIGR00730 family Rossman fold protein [Planctomycetota bacterium]
MADARVLAMHRNVCVFCGSRDGDGEAFARLAEDFGAAIGQRGWTLVYGGGTLGLMGRIAQATQRHGGRVVGVIPEAMDSVEVAYRDAEELIVVDTMRCRKQIMDDRADAFVVLPGGFGTLEELSEVITHRYLDYHAKPVILLNHDGFYDPLIELFEHFIGRGFAGTRFRDAYVVTDDVEATLAALEAIEA